MQKHFDSPRSLSAGKNGFTIIELIVVIAIIAVLAGIVLVNITQYTAKSKDAAVKAEAKQIQSYGAQYFEAHGNYQNFNTDPTIQNIMANVGKIYNDPVHIGSVKINPTDYSTFCYVVTLAVQVIPGPTSYSQWCVDSKGFAGQFDGGVTTGCATNYYCGS